MLAIALALLVGALSGLGQPGGDLPALTVGALVAFFGMVLVSRSTAVALGRAVAFGTAQFAVALLGTSSWGLSVPIALGAFGVATQDVPFALFARWAARRLSLGAAVAALLAFVVLCEELRELTGLPFKYAVVLTPHAPALAGGARLFGASFLSGVLFGACFASAYVWCRGERWTRALGPLAVGAAVLLGLSALGRLSAPRERGGVETGVAQVNASASVYRSRMISPELRRAFAADVERLLVALDPAELVVTTEAYDGAFGLMFESVRKEWAERAARRRQALVVTGYLAEPSGRKSNAAAGFDPQGRLAGVHRKVRLAPVGEATLAAGPDYVLLPILPRGGQLGVLICLESQLVEGPLELVRRGANLLAVTTSDVTFGSTVTTFQHLAMTRLRAIEMGRDVVWASNAGPSGVIDRWGQFRAGPFRERAAVRGRASLHAGLTPYARFREVWLGLCAALLAFLVTIAVRRPLASPPSFERRLPSALALRGYARLAATLVAPCVAVACVLLSPAWVHTRQGGRSFSALDASREILGRQGTPLPSAAPYTPFTTEASAAARGALAYLLTYYGLDTTHAMLERDVPENLDLRAAAALLRARFGITTARRDLRRDPPPNLAWLVELTDGSIAAADFAGQGQVNVFVPRFGRVLLVPPERLTDLVKSEAYVPYHAGTR